MKNKGQVLIGVVLLIPFLFISLFLVFEISDSISIKKRMESVVLDAIYSGLRADYRDSYNIVDTLINKNLEYDEIDIDVNDEVIEVEIIKNTDYKIIKRIKVHYIGYYQNLKIEKE